MKRKTKKIIVSLSLANALIMLIFSFFILNQPLVKLDERELIKWTSNWREKIIKNDAEFKNDFLFINIANDKELIDKFDEFGLPNGNQTITDRKKLADFLKIVNKSPDNYKYLLFDILLIDNSPNDSILGAELKKAKNIIIASTTNEIPQFNVNKGLVEFTANEKVFVKYKLLENDTLRSIPLKIYEELNKTKLVDNEVFYTFDNQRVFHNFIINLRIKTDDVIDTSHIYPFIGLGEILQLPDSAVNELVKNRIVILGDFTDKKNDYHQTVSEFMPGALLLANVYLALVKGDNIVPYTLFIILYVSFFLISLLVFYPINIFEKWSEKITKRIPNAKLADYFVGFITYATILSVISTICFLLFNLHVNVLYLTTYIYGLEKLTEIIRKKITEKNKNKDNE